MCKKTWQNVRLNIQVFQCAGHIKFITTITSIDYQRGLVVQWLMNRKASKLKSLGKQKPPHDFTRARHLIQKHMKHWNASEFQVWVLCAFFASSWTFRTSLVPSLCSSCVCYLFTSQDFKISNIDVVKGFKIMSLFTTFNSLGSPVESIIMDPSCIWLWKQESGY